MLAHPLERAARLPEVVVASAAAQQLQGLLDAVAVGRPMPATNRRDHRTTGRWLAPCVVVGTLHLEATLPIGSGHYSLPRFRRNHDLGGGCAVAPAPGGHGRRPGRSCSSLAPARTAAKHPGHFSTKNACSQSWSSTSSPSAVIPQATRRSWSRPRGSGRPGQLDWPGRRCRGDGGGWGPAAAVRLRPCSASAIPRVESPEHPPDRAPGPPHLLTERAGQSC
jgi:hypothetical protein